MARGRSTKKRWRNGRSRSHAPDRRHSPWGNRTARASALMPRPLPVNLLLAGAGSVLLVSGIGGQPIGEVLKGSFGDLKGKTKTAANLEGSGTFSNVASVGEESPTSGAPAASAPSSSTFAPSPDVFHKHVSRQQESRSIAAILHQRGITNPTHRQIEEARKFYHTK